MTAPDLKPCPFCGAEPLVENICDQVFVSCPTVHLEPIMHSCGALQIGIDRWNTRAALAASPLVQEIVAEAVQGQWVPTTDRLPEKPGIDSYEHVRCLIVVNGEIEIGMWNCEHLCWDDDEGDDYRYDPYTPTRWMPLPAPPAAIRARGEG